MGEVTQFQRPEKPAQKAEPFDKDAQRWATGKIKCLACKHEWVGAYTVPSVDLECPECNTFRGVSKGPYTASESEVILVCKCGNTLLEILVSPKGKVYALCSGCGIYHDPNGTYA